MTLRGLRSLLTTCVLVFAFKISIKMLNICYCYAQLLDSYVTHQLYTVIVFTTESSTVVVSQL